MARGCLQASLGFVLPTLLVWRQQLRAARAHAQRQRQRQPLNAARAPGGLADGRELAAADAELARCEYARLCQPVLEAVDAYGGCAVPVAVAALAGFVAATLVRPGAAV